MMHRFFLKRLRRHLTALLVPLFVLSFIFTIFAGQSVVHNIKEQGTSSIDAINSIFSSVTSACFTQQNIMTLNTSLASSMKRVLHNKETFYSDSVYMNSINSFLRSSAAYSSCINSIYLYLDGYNSYYSSEKIICHFGTSDDSAWYDTYASMPEESNTYIYARSLSGGQEPDTLTVFQRLSYLKGVVVGNLSVSELDRTFSNLLPTYPCLFYITDSQGKTLFRTSESSIIYAKHFSLNNPVPSSLSEIQYGTGLNRYQLYAKYNSNLNIYYVIAVPYSAICSIIFSELVWLLVAIGCIIGVAILESYLETKANFDQINHVITLFDDAEKGIYPTGTPVQQPRNEYDLIMNNIITLFLNTTFLNSQLAEQKYQKKIAELTALQLQINPHFMINTLQSLIFEICQRSGTTSPEYRTIRNLSDILQYSLADPSQSVTVSDEINYIHKYIEIQKYRFPDSFIYYEDVDDSSLDVPFRRLLLQPILENSISHGIRPSGRKGLIKLHVYSRNQILHVSVTDNGVGLNRETLARVRKGLETEPHDRIGLSNVNRRLILTYGTESRLCILSKAGLGTSVSFIIRISP